MSLILTFPSVYATFWIISSNWTSSSLFPSSAISSLGLSPYTELWSLITVFYSSSISIGFFFKTALSFFFCNSFQSPDKNKFGLFNLTVVSIVFFSLSLITLVNLMPLSFWGICLLMGIGFLIMPSYLWLCTGHFLGKVPWRNIFRQRLRKPFSRENFSSLLSSAWEYYQSRVSFIQVQDLKVYFLLLEH